MAQVADLQVSVSALDATVKEHLAPAVDAVLAKLSAAQPGIDPASLDVVKESIDTINTAVASVVEKLSAVAQ